LRPAEEVVADVGGGHAEALAEEGWAIDAVGQSGSLAVECPDERHSVRDKEVHAVCEGEEIRIVPPHGDDVRIGEIHAKRSRLTAEEAEIIGKFRIGGDG